MNNTFIVAILALFTASTALWAAEPPRSKIKRFVLQVCLAPEYGSDKGVASRWMTAPTVSVFGATAGQKALVEEVLRTIAPSLQPSIGEIRLLPDSSEAATMKVYFAPMKDFQRIAREHKVALREDNWGRYWLFWDHKNEVKSTLVLLATDKLTGDRLRHFAFEEIMQSFGLAQDSDEFPDSVFYERGSDGGNATRPATLDLQLLAWFYRHVTPGDSRKVISEKFDATWPKAK